MELDLLRQPAHVQLRLLARGEVTFVAEDSIVALGVVLHCGQEGKARQLG
jgi:hypothetical protein